MPIFVLGHKRLKNCYATSIVTKMFIIIHTHIHVTSLAIVKNRSICKEKNKHLYLAIPTERGLSTLYTLLVNKVLVAPH